MNNDEYSKGKEMYDLCMKNTLYNCTKKIDLF
jgi:hypothetical protein